MKQKSRPPLRLTPHYSIQLAAYLITTHLVALLVVITLVRPWWFAIGMVAVILFSLVQSYRRHLQYRGHNVIRAAELNGQDEWILQQANGDEISAQLQSNSYIHPILSALNFCNEQGKRQSLILLPDGIDAESFRRLRVRLKLKQTGT
ncbi:MAG: hypothetical protein L3J28_14930 [Candidatus Polarisedimenticolaceae bacterium]|nr:hypothetical protein [Candidatus Polarisedimenticolaceae bacterium]